MIVPEPEDLKPFAKFKAVDFQRWLRIGLEGYLLEDKGVWAFEPLAVFIGQDEHLVLDLCNISRAFPARQQAYLRQGVANLLANLEPVERNIVLFEHLLYLASMLPAGDEVLPVLPSVIGNGFFGLTETREGKSLFDLTMLTVAELAVHTKDAVDCLYALIGSRHFRCAYAGTALTALCRADDKKLAKHMSLLRESLSAMFEQYKIDDAAKRRLAEKILNAIGLYSLVNALPELVYSFISKRYVVNDDWFWEALFRTNPPLLSVSTDGEVRIYRSDKPEVRILLPEKKHKTEPMQPTQRVTVPLSPVNLTISQKIQKANHAFLEIFGMPLCPETRRKHCSYQGAIP